MRSDIEFLKETEVSNGIRKDREAVRWDLRREGNRRWREPEKEAEMKKFGSE